MLNGGRRRGGKVCVRIMAMPNENRDNKKLVENTKSN